MVQIRYIIFYYKRSDHIFTFCFLKVDSKKAALWRTNLKHSVFTVKAMVAWHMRIFCCKTFFGQNSHINFIELYYLKKYRCNKNTKKRNIFKFNSKCLEKGVFLKEKTLHTLLIVELWKR